MLLSLFISFTEQHSDRDTGAADKLSASVSLSLLCFPASLPESLPESLTVCQCSCRDSGSFCFLASCSDAETGQEQQTETQSGALTAADADGQSDCP